MFVVVACVWLVTCLVESPLRAQPADYLSDRAIGLSLRHQQQWGDFGWDRAAARTGGSGSALRIGTQQYERGLGHHANGEIVVELGGQYRRFQAVVGVQWQGGSRGSVTFRVFVDDRLRFETGPMSDSDAAREVDVPVVGARTLRLVASDSGDGIGCDMANWAEARLLRDPGVPAFAPGQIRLSGQPAPAQSAAAGGFVLIAGDTGPQLAVMATAAAGVACVRDGEEVRLSIPVRNGQRPLRFRADVRNVGERPAEVGLSIGPSVLTRSVKPGERMTLASDAIPPGDAVELVLTTCGTDGETGVRWSNLRYVVAGEEFAIPWRLADRADAGPPPVLPDPRPPIEQALIRWDWRMQDGIGTPRAQRTWRQATELVVARGQQLVQHLADAGTELGELITRWEAVRSALQTLSADPAATEADWESLWTRAHSIRRQIALANPLVQCGPLAFIKRVPSSFSHQLTQYAGRRARPGGGVYVLEAPGRSMRTRRVDDLPGGSYLHLDVSWDGRRLLFAFCPTESDSGSREAGPEGFYHLFEIHADGSSLRQLTTGPYDDFAARYLPNGKLMFVSTRRGGFHRCGRGPCPVYTLAVANGDGSEPTVVSFHETHEWDPAVLNDGRVIYTRWDYVDRHAVHYQQLWTVRPDGTDVRIFYGNNTLNPVGVWEARPIPGSSRVMATAAAHHAMTAGSIILLDVARGVDGLEPITRLTPDVLFPESEAPVQRWHATAGVPVPPELPVAQRRWPGHCYRTPFPFSEHVFLAAYSYDELIGEPHANPPNMFGIYLVDRFGNKELLYRDPSISSLWPAPLRARRRPPVVASQLAAGSSREGTFWLQDVYASWPELARSSGVVKRLRIVQVLPKTTPHANTPRVGLANASPGKQVLGTVPVEADGSAYFRAPAGIPLAFQALDDRGMAIQTMRSVAYLQPGEQSGCVGCHEHRATAPPYRAVTMASRRPPSAIAPGPEGSQPFSYPILVQPVLDKHCTQCHGPSRADGGLDLTGTPDGAFTRSYQALAPRVPFSEWKGTPQANHEPLTYPGQFGARASRLTELLLDGHEGVRLSPSEYERLITWMDTNALFYGTFDPQDQRRQQQGERIAGPALE